MRVIFATLRVILMTVLLLEDWNSEQIKTSVDLALRAGNRHVFSAERIDDIVGTANSRAIPALWTVGGLILKTLGHIGQT